MAAAPCRNSAAPPRRRAAAPPFRRAAYDPPIVNLRKVDITVFVARELASRHVGLDEKYRPLTARRER